MDAEDPVVLLLMHPIIWQQRINESSAAKYLDALIKGSTGSSASKNKFLEKKPHVDHTALPMVKIVFPDPSFWISLILIFPDLDFPLF